MVFVLLGGTPVLRSFFVLGTGEAFARILHVLAFLCIARSLDKEGLGQFGLMVTISSYVLLVVQQGFDTLAIREVARSRDEVRRYTERIIGLRLLIAAAAFVIVVGWVTSGRLQKPGSMLLIVLSLRYFITAISPQWSFLVLGEPRVIASATVVSQAIFLVGALLLRDPSQVIWAAVAQVSGELVGAVYQWYALCRRDGWVVPAVDREFWLHLIRKSWPMSGSLLLGNLLYNFDVVALGWLSTSAEIGLYLACYRCVTVFSPLMVVLFSAVFPSFARAFPDGRKARRIALQIGLPTLAGTLLLAMTLGWGAGRILTVLYGDSFREGQLILQVLAWTLPIQATRNILRQILIAFHMESRDTMAMGFAVATNVSCDFLLAPIWGALGCAVSTVLSELVLLTVVVVLARRCLVSEAPAAYIAQPFVDAAIPCADNTFAMCAHNTENSRCNCNRTRTELSLASTPSLPLG